MRKLLTVILIFISLLASGQEKIDAPETDSCKCKTIINSFKYFEKSVYKKKEHYFYPQRPVILYGEGDTISAPINKHIRIMLECVPIEITLPSKLLIYKIEQNELEKWDKWIKVYCEQNYLKYRKHNHFTTDNQK